ncbi:MAG: hypothetical protein EAZ34_07825 [Polaromonas sp.]|nr:MAG: hypothetical protein EAZ34_07825 [Polaromonas sp.]
MLVLAFALAGWKTVTRLPAAQSPQQSPEASARLSEPVANPLNSASRPLQRSVDGHFMLDAQFVSSTPGQAVHAASMVELLNGSLRAVWFSGSREGAGDVSVQTAVMDAATLQWGVESTLFERHQIERGLWRYVKKIGNPVIARAPDGALWLWMVNVSLGGWAGSAITWSRSTDEGISWSQPRRLVTSPFLNISTLVKGAPLALADGQIALPVYHEFITKLGEILRIDAQGRVVDKVRIPGSQTSLQPVVLVTSPTSADVYMRSGNAKALMASTTDDAGKTWTTTRATAWPNPDASIAGVVTRSGVQWLALNPATNHRQILALLRTGSRTEPQPGSQTDKKGYFEGASQWIVESSATPTTRLPFEDYERVLGRELAASGVAQNQISAYVASARRQLCSPESCWLEFSYPHLLQSRDGYIHLIYTWHRTRIKHIRLDPLQPAPTVQPTGVNVVHVPPTH